MPNTRMERVLQELKTCIDLMKQLRDPKTGCGWDLEQTHQSLIPYLQEEAQECKKAIEKNDTEELKEELGDLLLQILFHCQMASETGQFDLGDVAKTLSEKLVRRHPHVFGSQEDRKHRDNPKKILQRWHEIKAEERATKKNRSKTS